ncbi:hypothetical protein KR018_010325, partial [Drosophila ironensis]
MSKRAGARLMAYVSAEEHLLDIYSPMAGHEVAPAPGQQEEQEQEQQQERGQQQQQQVLEQQQQKQERQQQQEELDLPLGLDPALDSMLHVISDDSDIHSLIASDGCSDEFKGWDHPCSVASTASDCEPLIYGMCRMMGGAREGARPPAQVQVQAWEAHPSKRPRNSHEVLEIDGEPTLPYSPIYRRLQLPSALPDSPENSREPGLSLLQAVAHNPGVLLTNGGVDQYVLAAAGDDDEDEEEAALQEMQGNGQQCVMYETEGENMVVLSEEHCCEIIVATQGVANEQEFARAILMAGNGAGALLGLLPDERGAGGGVNQRLNGTAYIEEVMEELGEDEARSADGDHVYLSDAALKQPLGHVEMVDDEANEDNENATFVDDTPMEEERPDICEVYDHELEEHDDEEDEEEPTAPPIVPLVMKLGPQEQPRKLTREHSSPTEFPVSSSSMPNGSYNYDYEDEDLMGGPHVPSKVAPLKRKYAPLMKNTLYAEAMDRRLASICQAQPQMSPAEKVFTWETVASEECAGVEDVETFQAAFEQHEATKAPLRAHTFEEFRNMLVRNMDQISRNIMEASESVSEQTTSQTPERPPHRRLLHVLPTEETIVLDDDEDDCYEVVNLDRASLTTLVPQEELQEFERPAEEEQLPAVPSGELKTIETQTPTQRQRTRKTSTTDLTAPLPPAVQHAAVSTETPETPRRTTQLSPETPNEPPQSETVPLPMAVPMPLPAAVPMIGPVPGEQLANAVIDAMRQQAQMQMQIQMQMQQQQRMGQSMQNQESQTYRFGDVQGEQHGKLCTPPGCAVSIAAPPLPTEMPMRSMECSRGPPYGSCPNDSMFYEQQEFCNYLGLTELATANAVASAMRELANSTVARRSLRVRPQQQLERMRNDVRGRRREWDRERPQEAGKKQAMTTSSEQSTDKEDIFVDAKQPGDALSDLVNKLASATSEERRPALTMPYDIPYRVGGGSSHRDDREEVRERSQEQEGKASIHELGATTTLQCQQRKLHEENRTIASVEDLFAKVYEAAAPPQPQPMMLESMQQRLRQARETKPSIYIIQSTNNAAVSQPHTPHTAHTAQPPRRKSSSPLHIETPQRAVPAKASPSKSTRPVNVKKSPSTVTAKASRHRKTLSGTKAAGVPKRRSTTAASSLVGKVRDLVTTRSTTHLNSKLLRNRKVNLLKSYALPDAMGGRGKRLSGGSSQSAKKGAKMFRPEHRDKPLPKQHRLEHQQAPPNTPRKGKPFKRIPTPTLSMAKTPNRAPGPLRRKDKRANSLPGKLGEPSKDAIPTSQKTLTDDHKSAMLEAPIIAQPVLIYPPSTTSASLSPKVSAQRRVRQQAGNAIVSPDEEVDSPSIESTPPGGLLRLSEGSLQLPNPLNAKYGKVLHMYYEMDQLIVLQECYITFWKYSKVFNLLKQERHHPSPRHRPPTPDNLSAKLFPPPEEIPATEWVNLGRLRRISNGKLTGRGDNRSIFNRVWVYATDTEVYVPYGSRMCMHNSTPVYLEMRGRPTEHHKREGKLTTMHVNVYYFCEEELRPRMHSVHLDAVNCDPANVIFTSIEESRYFVMAWQQDVVMGKPRTGLCKYSLTPALDTLASIREFKQLRHELYRIECLSEDRLIGYGATRITVWDHRSGDTMMNYDLGRPLGHNLAAMHYPSLDVDQSSMLVLYQHVSEPNGPNEVHVVACELSHASPTHRLLHVHRLPAPYFNSKLEAVNTGDHVIINSISNDEAWISVSDPRQLTYLAPLANGARRYYARHKSQVIEMSLDTLTVDSIANHMLKLAVQQQQQA